MQQSWIAIYIAAAIIAANGHVQDLRVSVTPIQTRFAAVQNVNVILSYSNTGGDTMFMYKWYFPENGLSDSLFEVTRDGEPVEYVGPVAKRPAPTADDLISLTPGMTVSTAVQLSTVYNMTQTGNYVIQYKMNADQVLFTIDNMPRHRMASFIGGQEPVLRSAPIVVFAIGRRNLLVEQAIETGTHVRALTPTLIGCSSSQAAAISSAMLAAESYNNNALQHLNAQSSGTTRYTTWFGRHSSSNWITLKSHYTKVQSVLSSKTVSFDCTCPAEHLKTAYAYVYKAQPYKVYLCNAYWSAPTTGTDTKGGTIIHELAHFTVVADANDHAYTHSDCKSLALSNPAMAIMNADSLEYFAENNPRLN
jgi:peptidyl-Lys metalloendopeptidase